MMEGVIEDRVFQVGNTVVDSLIDASKNPPKEVTSFGSVHLKVIFTRQDKASELKLNLETKELLKNGNHVVLVTAHRRENAASGAFSRFGTAIATLSKKYPEVMFVVPLHYNPAV